VGEGVIEPIRRELRLERRYRAAMTVGLTVRR